MSVVGDKPVVASWSDTGKVFLWDISHPLQAVNDSAVLKNYIDNKESPRPLFVFKGNCY
jgi:ribosome assembly protein RRB1